MTGGWNDAALAKQWDADHLSDLADLGAVKAPTRCSLQAIVNLLERTNFTVGVLDVRGDRGMLLAWRSA